ncbi:MAG: hypothetical protein N4A40_12880 [Tissierellales bacterium]|nr:hypothetical protein [Tissierellales bacterium]
MRRKRSVILAYLTLLVVSIIIFYLVYIGISIPDYLISTIFLFTDLFYLLVTIDLGLLVVSSHKNTNHPMILLLTTLFLIFTSLKFIIYSSYNYHNTITYSIVKVTSGDLSMVGIVPLIIVITLIKLSHGRVHKSGISSISGGMSRFASGGAISTQRGRETRDIKKKRW